jgi:hypothetical protein
LPLGLAGGEPALAVILRQSMTESLQLDGQSLFEMRQPAVQRRQLPVQLLQQLAAIALALGQHSDGLLSLGTALVPALTSLACPLLLCLGGIQMLKATGHGL